MMPTAHKPMIFPKFGDLAPELRLKIFAYAMPTTHIVPFRVFYTTTDGFEVTYDHEAPSDLLPLITTTSTRGLSHTCRELREIYLSTFPDRVELKTHGVIWLNYQTSIIHLSYFHELFAQPAISHVLFGQEIRQGSPILQFPCFFAKICQLALSLDYILEYPEALPYPFPLMTFYIEHALFAKMLQPFTSLTHLWAVAEEYWKLDIILTRQGYFQPYPGEINISVLGRLAERLEQLALWTDYQNEMIQAKKNAISANKKMTTATTTSTTKTNNDTECDTVYVTPRLIIWGMEDLELWDYLTEFWF